MKGDEEIRLAVIDELRWETQISNPTAIGVAVNDGVVTLSGYVDNFSDKYVAQTTAQSVPGVKAVIPDIQVNPARDTEIDDLKIAKDVSNAIELNSSIPQNQIKVLVKNGKVTLDGELEWEHQKDEAENTISKIPGIRGIANNITVGLTRKPHDIKYRIEKAFQRMASHHARHIQIEVQDSKAILSGIVYAWVEKMEAERIIREIPGIKEVENNLTITPLLEGRENPPCVEAER